ncbi:MAG: hypothetical protein ACRDD5_22190 [Silvania sp.]|uniref:hypothetical protein n=1 Tax=Silvania sp. TaxID=3016633 RepID=UPI003EE44318
MTVEWVSFIHVLGKHEHSVDVINLCQAIGEPPDISADSGEYNDPDGKTKYYKFYQSGIEMGFRKDCLNHIHFYFGNEDGYSPFAGNFVPGIKAGMDRVSVANLLGQPTLSGEGKSDMLLGYINGWLKYENVNYAIHLQFEKNNQLCHATLIKK